MGDCSKLGLKFIDRILCFSAIIGIRCYQLLGRKIAGRVCLFKPTCSHRVIKMFQKGNFRFAWADMQKQLGRCRGDYSLRLGLCGNVELITNDGEIIPEAELSDRIVSRMKMFADFAGDQTPSIVQNQNGI